MLHAAGAALVEAIRAREVPDEALPFWWQSFLEPFDRFSLPTDDVEWLRALEAMEGGDRWMRAMILGHYYFVSGWRIRGHGFINSVPDEDLREFHRRLKIAEGHLIEAHQQRSASPEPAAGLVDISSALGPLAKHPFDHWFRAAKDVEFDFRPAYDALVNALLPRWNGSHEEMISFGRWCAGTNRYDTRVPAILIDMIYRIGQEDDRMFNVLRENRALAQEALLVLDRLLAANTARVDVMRSRLDWEMIIERRRIDLTAAVCIALRIEEYDRARGYIDNWGLFVMEHKASFWGYRENSALKYSLLYGGPGGEAARRAYAEEEKENLHEALKLLREARAAPQPEGRFAAEIKAERDRFFAERIASVEVTLLNAQDSLKPASTKKR